MILSVWAVERGACLVRGCLVVRFNSSYAGGQARRHHSGGRA